MSREQKLELAKAILNLPLYTLILKNSMFKRGGGVVLDFFFESLYFGELEANAKFHNPRTTSSLFVIGSKREKRENKLGLNSAKLRSSVACLDYTLIQASLRQSKFS